MSTTKLASVSLLEKRSKKLSINSLFTVSSCFSLTGRSSRESGATPGRRYSSGETLWSVISITIVSPLRLRKDRRALTVCPFWNS